MSWQSEMDECVNKTELEYECKWCGKVFKQRVGKGKGACKYYESSQVQCPKCKNFIPTYE